MRLGPFPARTIDRLLDSVPPASGFEVMGTGIVSVALLLDGRHVLSTVMLILDAGIWLSLALLLPARALRDQRRFAADLRRPAALTAIAGTEVLATRLTLAGWELAGIGLLVLGTLIWPVLVPRVLRHWQTPTTGASFILTMATESLALLAATVAWSARTGWLVYLAIAPFCAGLGFYAFVLKRFDFRQLGVGAGDHWVTGGALAISALAGGRIALAAERTAALTSGQHAFKTIALVLWCLAMVWLPALIIAELVRARPSYNVRRWSTVRSIGTYAACSFTVGQLTRTSTIIDFARLSVWVAFGVWLVVFAALVRRAPTLVMRTGDEPAARRRLV